MDTNALTLCHSKVACKRLATLQKNNSSQQKLGFFGGHSLHIPNGAYIVQTLPFLKGGGLTLPKIPRKGPMEKFLKRRGDPKKGGIL